MKPAHTKHRGRNRVADTIRIAALDVLRRRSASFPMAVFTLTGVEVSPDYALATLRFTLHEETTQRVRILELLDEAKPRIRHELGRRLHTRITPEVRFLEDRGIAAATHVDAILAELAAERGPEDAAAVPEPAEAQPPSPSAR